MGLELGRPGSEWMRLRRGESEELRDQEKAIRIFTVETTPPMVKGGRGVSEALISGGGSDIWGPDIGGALIYQRSLPNRAAPGERRADPRRSLGQTGYITRR